MYMMFNQCEDSPDLKGYIKTALIKVTTNWVKVEDEHSLSVKEKTLSAFENEDYQSLEELPIELFDSGRDRIVKGRATTWNPAKEITKFPNLMLFASNAPVNEAKAILLKITRTDDESKCSSHKMELTDRVEEIIVARQLLELKRDTPILPDMHRHELDDQITDLLLATALIEKNARDVTIESRQEAESLTNEIILANPRRIGKRGRTSKEEMEKLVANLKIGNLENQLERIRIGIESLCKNEAWILDHMLENIRRKRNKNGVKQAGINEETNLFVNLIDKKEVKKTMDKAAHNGKITDFFGK